MTGDFSLSKVSMIDTDELETYFDALASQLGPIPTQLANGLSLGVEVFTLSEGFGISPYYLQTLWRHSVRTGYLAAFIAHHQEVDHDLAWEAFVGGLLHDIGMLIFLTQQPRVFLAVVELAQCRGRELREIEENFLGTTHAASGAKFLARWGVSLGLQDIVTYHDQPFQSSYSGFCPLTAVYVANMLEGGGIAQDADGVLEREGEAYLRQLALWDKLPSWQRRIREISLLSV